MTPNDLEVRGDLDALTRLLAARAEGGGAAADGTVGAADRARVERLLAAAPASTAPTVPPGPARCGDYVLRRPLGRGAQGEVWLAEDLRLKRLAAVKILHRDVDADGARRFFREVECAARVEHPGVCTVYDVGSVDGRPWMAMRYVAGETFAQRLTERAGPPADRAACVPWCRIVAAAARAAHAAHEADVVHRDLKPSNVLLGEDDRPVIVDFGLARDATAATPAVTRTGAVVGTPAYMAPEQLCGATTDRRADVYALGAMIFEALAGRRVREAPTVAELRRGAFATAPRARSLNSAVPRDLDVVVATALAPEADRRYRTALEFADDLDRALAGEPIRARTPSPAARAAAWARRNRALAAVLASLAAVLATGLAVSSALWLSAERLGVDLATRNADLRRRTAELLQLADVRRVRELAAAERELWPVSPDLTRPCEEWLTAAAAMASRREDHRRARDAAAVAAREASALDAREEAAWTRDALDELLAALDALDRAAVDVAARQRRSRDVADRTVGGAAAEAWGKAAAEIAAAPAYGDLRVAPQIGLVPLGRNDVTGLFEFWHVETGGPPAEDDEDGGWRPAVGSGLVLALIPPGEYALGAAEDDADADDGAERPRQTVRLDAFFVSKCETTQDQWERTHLGRNPSQYHAKADRRLFVPNEKHGPLDPVERVSHADAADWARRMDLELPTEARWEAAARGRADGRDRWCFGDDPAAAAESANSLGREWRDPDWADPGFADGRLLHRAVASLRPNGFGLYDVHGNVAEWCADAPVRRARAAAPRTGDGLRADPADPGLRIARGGSFRTSLRKSRLSARAFLAPETATAEVGVRAVRSLR